MESGRGRVLGIICNRDLSIRKKAICITLMSVAFPSLFFFLFLFFSFSNPGRIFTFSSIITYSPHDLLIPLNAVN